MPPSHLDTLSPELQLRIQAFLQAQSQTDVMNTSGPTPGDGRNRSSSDKSQHNAMQQHLSRGAHAIRSFLHRLAPFGLQMLVSGVSYGTGLCVIQVIGASLRVSCVTPVLSSCLGVVGAGASSALAGHMSRHTSRLLESGKGPLDAIRTPFWKDFNAEEAVMDAVSGLIIFKMAGGSFCRLMPSDLRAAGAFAQHSVPLSSAKYATDTEKGQLVSIFKRDGCHHCGTRRGPVIGDHIPPNKLLKDAQEEAQVHASTVMGQIKILLSGAGAPGSLPKQAYYAQCNGCSQAQSNLMRHGRRSALVMHRVTVAPGLLPGVLVGFRHLCEVSGGGSGGSTSHQRHSSGKKSGRVAVEKQPGIWSWVTRVEEQPGQDVFCSFEDKGLLGGGTSSQVTGVPAML